MSNQQKIASFDDALDTVASKYGIDISTWHALKGAFLDHFIYVEAAELYAETKARQSWDRACDTIRQESLNQPCKMCYESTPKQQDEP